MQLLDSLLSQSIISPVHTLNRGSRRRQSALPKIPLCAVECDLIIYCRFVDIYVVRWPWVKPTRFIGYQAIRDVPVVFFKFPKNAIRDTCFPKNAIRDTCIHTPYCVNAYCTISSINRSTSLSDLWLRVRSSPGWHVLKLFFFLLKAQLQCLYWAIISILFFGTFAELSIPPDHLHVYPTHQSHQTL